MDKYVTDGQVTEDYIIRRMLIACWMTKATDTHSECVLLTAVSSAVMVTGARLYG